MTDLKIGDEVYIHGFVDEVRMDTVIIKNEGGYFGTVAEEIIPSAQPEPQWIPCNWHKDTENLPDECKSVLICIKDKIGTYVDVSYRTDYNRWERYGRNINVVAWMPLPEPWRGEEHERG